MAALSPADRRLVATGRSSEIKAPAPVAPATPAAAPAVVVTPVAAAPAAEVAPAAPAEPGTPAASPEGASPGEGGPGSEGEGSKRFRFTGEDDKAVAQLAKSRGISLVEASRIYAGDAPPAAPAAPVPAPAAEPVAALPDPVVTGIDTKITEAQQRLTELTAQRDAADDDLDRKGSNKLNDQITDLKADIRLMENEKKGHVAAREQEVQQTYKAGVDAARERVFSEFKVFADRDSRERLALDAYVTRAINDPARKAEFKNPAWPETLAREYAQKYGIQPTAAAGTAPAPVAPAAAPRPAVLPKAAPVQVAAPADPRLLTGADGRSSSAPRQLTREELLQKVRTDPEARRAVVRQLHSKPR